MSPFRTIIAALTLAAVVGGAAHAQTSPAAQRVIDRARQASGGAAAWNNLRGVHEVGTSSGAAFERWSDPIRYGFRSEVADPAGGKRVRGYNGYGEWWVAPDGTSSGSDAPADLAEARSDAFLAAHGFFFPSRFERRGSLVGTRRSGSRSFDVVRIEPAGGEPRELWFDRLSGHLSIIVDDLGARQSRTELSDYRPVSGLLLPHRIEVMGGGRSATDVFVFERIELAPTDRALFSLPRPEESAPGS